MRKEAQATPNILLKAQRLKKNWSQVYVAMMIETNDVTVSRWENGTSFPSLYYREKLCTLFGKSPDELGFVATTEVSQAVGQDRYQEAEPLFQRAARIWEQWDPKHPRRGRPLHHLGRLYLQEGRYREAETILQRAVRNLEQWVHEQPHALDDLGRLFWKEGRYRVAEAWLQPEIAWKLGLGIPRPYVAHMYNSLAELYTLQGKYVEAESLLQRAVTTWEPIDCQHIWAANSLDGLARLYTLQGKYTGAELLFRRSLSVRERWQGREHPDTLVTVEGYAHLLVKMHREEEADVVYSSYSNTSRPTSADLTGILSPS